MQNDVVAIYDVDGAIKAWYTYDAWGNVLTATGDLAELNPIRYRGYYYDNETGYYYCQSRYYNPEWCRWISADAYMDTEDGILGTNMYAYCHNDPVNFNDPSGYAITPETIVDFAGFVWSAKDWVNDKSFMNTLFLAWDITAILLPVVPGSYTYKGVKYAADEIGRASCRERV